MRSILLNFLIDVFMGVLIGCLIGFPWLYPEWFPLSVFGWACLIAAAAKKPRFRATVFCFSIGMLSLGIAFHWAPESIAATTNLSEPMSFVFFLGLVAWESIAFALLGLFASIWMSRGETWLWALAPTWVAIEYVHPQIFSWSLAHTFLRFPPILQIAEFTGTAGVASLVFLLSLSIARAMIAHRSYRSFLECFAGLSIVAAACLWGIARADFWRQKSSEAKKLRVVAIQVDPSQMGSVEEMQNRSASVSDPVDLYIWPESSLGNYHASLEDFRDEVKTIMNSEQPNPAITPFPELRTELLANGKTFEDGGRDVGPYKNTTMLIDSEMRIKARYVKRSLLPIGEYVPGESWLPFLRDWAALESELVRGISDEPIVLAGGEKVGVLICYEDMVPENACATTRTGAQCLIAMINGSRFADIDTLIQHGWLAQLRTIENRRAFVRCAATGVTCIIAPDGTISHSLPPKKNGMLVASIPLINEKTFYCRYGEWFSYLAIIAAISSLFTRRFHSQRS